MARTKTEAIKQRKIFDKQIKNDLQTIIIDNSKKFGLNSEVMRTQIPSQVIMNYVYI